MDIGDLISKVGVEFDVIPDPKAPKGYRIIRIGQEPAKKDDGSVQLAKDDIDMSDDEIRDEIEALTGKRPHHKTGRAKLIEQWQAAYK